MKVHMFTIIVLVLSVALMVLPLSDRTRLGGSLAEGKILADAAPDVAVDTAILETVGHIGGATYAVAVEGSYAYIGVGPSLIILDITDPISPSVVGKTLPLAGLVKGIAVAGGYAYVAVGPIVEYLGGSGWQMGGGLEIVDVSTPANPRSVGFYATGSALDVAIVGDYAYVAASGLQVVNISIPSQPTGVGSLSGVTLSVAVAGDYAYVAGGHIGLRVVNVTNPANPWEVGHCDTPGGARDAVVVGNYAYVADYDAGLRVMDVSTPWSPAEVGFYDTPGYARAVAVAGNYAYVADGNGLYVVDVSTPSSPVPAGFCNMPGEHQYTSGVAVAGGHVYVAYSYSLRVVDVSAPGSPTEVGFYDAWGGARGVAISGDYAYVAGHMGGLWVVDISTPGSPAEVGFCDTLGPAQGVTVVGDYAYVAGWYAGLHVVDVSTPSNPTEIGFCDTPGSVQGMAVAGDYAYVAAGDLLIMDVSTPGSPVEVGHYTTSAYATDVAVAGGYAYVADGYEGGLQVVDVSNPAAPWGVGSCGEGYWDASSVAIAGGYAYVADQDWDGGLRVVDISNPVYPWQAGFYALPGNQSWGPVATAGSYVYIIDHYDYVDDIASFLYMIDVSTPTYPSEAASLPLPGMGNDMIAAGGYIYVANGGGGLLILRPLRDKVTGPIASTGGSLSSTSGDADFVFPSGAFTETVILTYRHLLDDQDTEPLVGIGHAFEVTAVYSSTGQPAQLVPGQTYTVTVHYTEAERGPAIEDTLGLYWWDDDNWSQEGITSSVNTIDNLVTAKVSHLSLFAVLGETRWLFLPVSLRSWD